MPPPKQRRLLERAPNFSKAEAGVKALVSVFSLFLFSSSLPVFALGALAPMLILPRYGTVLLADCPCFPARRKAYRLHPPSTSPGLEFDFAQVDGGTPAARYSGSAAGAGGQRDWRKWARGWISSAGRCASRVATHPPPSCKAGGLAPSEKICLLEPPSQQVILGSLRVSLYRNTGD